MQTKRAHLENRLIRYTFDVNLRSYEFPSGWEGTIESKIYQTILAAATKMTTREH